MMGLQKYNFAYVVDLASLAALAARLETATGSRTEEVQERGSAIHGARACPPPGVGVRQAIVIQWGEVEGMRNYVQSPDRGPHRGIWCYPPEPGGWPDYLCRTHQEGIVITGVASARQFFRDKCKACGTRANGLT
jgi:hypothetical protein